MGATQADGALKMEQILGELFLKASHIILGSRTTQPARAPQRKAAKSWVRRSRVHCIRPRDLKHNHHLLRLCCATPRIKTHLRHMRPLSSRCQFNLEVDEVHSAVRELEPWRKHVTVPLVIEVRPPAFEAQNP